ncbi:MAG: hypothetical protein WBP13_12555 [Methylophilaceae bacterium]
MKSTISELLGKPPEAVAKDYPQGEPFVTAFAHGSMSVELYTPTAVDIQTPHEQDELYYGGRELASKKPTLYSMLTSIKVAALSRFWTYRL